MQKLTFFFFLISPHFFILSQSLPYYPVDFFVNGVLLKNATAGGLDLPQFSSADLNNDGLADLYIFDKLGNVQLGFLNDGLIGEASYTFDFGLTENFPPLNEWVLLKDFNQDGAVDIFSYSDVLGLDGIQVYQGFWNAGKLDFSKLTFPASLFDLLPFSTGANVERIAPSKLDFPAFADLDDDGDLDILAFGSNSSYVEFYENQSVEMGYGLDSLIFQRADICWGKFLQDPISAAIIMSNNAADCAYNSPNLNAVHTIASSLIAMNLDGDGDKDLLFTNFENNELFFLHNNGSSSADAHITNIEAAFSTVNFPENPAFIRTPFHLDLNNDDQKDIIISNFVFGRESYEVGWFFKNTQTDENPDFALQQTDFLTQTMLDFGSGAHPTFVDFNADGLQDLVVGNAQKWDENGNRTASLQLFLNIGTTTQPQFELFDDNWLGFATDSVPHFNLAPDFGDLDGDNDLDLLVGESNGRLNYFENTAGENNPMSLVFVEGRFKNLNTIFNIGTELSPQIIDVNRDSLPDLLIGERNGNLNYFQNIGTATQPDFELNPESAPNHPLFGEVDLNFPGSSQGYTSPVLLDLENGFHLLVGSENRGVLEFTDIEDNLSGVFTEIDGEFSNTIRQGNFQNPALADLDADGFFEMAVGNMRGGLTFFKTNLIGSLIDATTVQISETSLHISPNPCTDELVVDTQNPSIILEQILLYDNHGRLLKSFKDAGQKIEISVKDLAAGAYILKGISAKNIWLKRILKVE